jgi:hypothetical protein
MLDITDPDLVPLLEGALDLREVARPVEEARYRFSMDNDFVSPTGRVLRQQRFRAEYTRRLVDALSPRTALFGFTWTRVEFASTSAQQSRTASQDPIRWTFAEGRTFEYYRPFPTSRFTGPRVHEEPTPEFRIGNWYDDLARLPSVNLLVMATWDVITFEAMTGVLACDGLGEYGVLRPIPTMDNGQVHLDFMGYSVENSTFENEAVLSHPIGLTLVADTLCTGIAFQGVGRLEVGGATHTDQSQQGESYFLGNCLLSTSEADLVSSEMTELLMVSMKNVSGKHVPMQKRRVVRITRAD